MSAEDGAVRLERRGPIATITFDRPDARNAMTWRMYEQLAEVLDQVESDAALRVVVLRGAGGHFVAGTDISQFAAFRSGDDGVAYERRLEAVVSTLESLRVATIAAVEGFAAGSGLVLAAACDLRLCTPDARFGVPIAKTLGNCLSMANYARLAASLGAARAKSLLFTAEFMTAAEAQALGFAVGVVEPHGFGRQLDTLCARVASLAPITLQVTKEALRRMVHRLTIEGDDLVHRAYASSDFREGIASFVAKRAPGWEGR